MEKAREILSKKVEIKNGEIHCFVDVILQAMEEYANQKIDELIKQTMINEAGTDNY